MNETSQISQLRAKSSISLSPTLTGLALVPATRVHPLPGHVSCISFGCVKGLDQRLRTSLNSSIGGWAPYFSCAVGFVTRKSKARKHVAKAAVKFWGMRKSYRNVNLATVPFQRRYAANLRRFFVWCNTPWPACWGRPQRPGNAYQRAGHSTLSSLSITAQLEPQTRKDGMRNCLFLRAAPLVQLPIDHILRGSGSVLKCRIQYLTLWPLELPFQHTHGSSWIYLWFMISCVWFALDCALKANAKALYLLGYCKGTDSTQLQHLCDFV